MSILGAVRMARLAGNLYNHGGIYRSSHVVIKPIICITFKYNPFSYRNTWILSFFIQERPIFGAGADGVAGAAGAVFRDTLHRRTAI